MIGTLVKNIRIKNNISQKDISEITKIDRGNISKIENNKRIPNLKHFVSLCEALQVTYDELKQLHFEYEKSVKPQQSQKLIYVEFAKSEYIVSLLLDSMHFKDEFMELYRQAYDGNKYVLYNMFLIKMTLIYEVISDYTLKETEDFFENTKIFYKYIDILKEHPQKIINFKSCNSSKDKDKKVKKFLERLIKIKKEYDSNKSSINSKNIYDFIEKMISKYNILSLYNYKEGMTYLVEIMKNLLPNPLPLDDKLKLVYKDDIYTNILYGGYFNFSHIIVRMLFDDENYFLIELEDGSYKFATFNFLLNAFTLKDILTPEYSPIENRFEFIFKEFKEVFDLAVDVLPIPKDDSSKAVYLEKITKFIFNVKDRLLYIDNKLNELKQLEENANKTLEEKNALDINTKYLKSKLKQYEEEIARLKQQLDDMKKEKE